jgi:hypothetical protein
VSLWRKRNVQHNGQNQPKWFNMTALANNDLSIKSDDLSIKSEKAMSEDVNQLLWVDPPEGWKYNFPAIYDPDTDGQLSEWIIKKGYPVSLIQEYGDVWAVRCWPVEKLKPSDESD